MKGRVRGKSRQLDAMRTAGRMLAEMELKTGPRPIGNTVLPILDDLGDQVDTMSI